jgi:hypothetical protein
LDKYLYQQYINMNMKISGNTRASEAAIVARQMADNAARQYNLGNEDLQRQLMGDDPSQVQSNTVSVFNPTSVSRISNQAAPVSGKSNGYNAKEMSKSDVPVEKANPNAVKAKEFITQTRALDNDLDHAIALFKLNNKDAFYKHKDINNVELLSYNKIVKEASVESQEEKDLKIKVTDLLKRFNKAKRITKRAGT